MQAFVTTGAAFPLAVLWLDLMFDVHPAGLAVSPVCAKQELIDS